MDLNEHVDDVPPLVTLGPDGETVSPADDDKAPEDDKTEIPPATQIPTTFELQTPPSTQPPNASESIKSELLPHVNSHSITNSFADTPRGQAPNLFALENWPVTGAWRAELDAVKDTHMISPLPAYGLDLEPIKPREYTRRLIGAIVEVQFSFISYIFPKDGRATLVGVIEEINVLVPPPLVPTSPNKRKFMERTMGKSIPDMPESPTKKGKLSFN